MTNYPLFEKRHFEWLANYAKINLRIDQCEELAAALSETNINFDKKRFLKACGIDLSMVDYELNH